MAVAAEALEGGAAGAEGGARAATEPGPGWQAVSRASGQLRRAPGAARSAIGSVSSPSAAAQTVTKLIWAIAVGLIVLEIAAQATGQQWSFALPSLGAQAPQKSAYQPLYAGQTAPASSALPGVFSGPVNVQSSLTNLSGRAGGNLAMG